MKKITLIKNSKKLKNGQVVSLWCKHTLFKVVKTKNKAYLEFVGISMAHKACKCECCTIGGVTSNLLEIPNNKKNCKQYKFVIEFEKDIDKKLKKRGKRENRRR